MYLKHHSWNYSSDRHHKSRIYQNKPGEAVYHWRSGNIDFRSENIQKEHFRHQQRYLHLRICIVSDHTLPACVMGIPEGSQPWKSPIRCTPSGETELKAISTLKATLIATVAGHASQDEKQTRFNTLSANGAERKRLPFTEHAVGTTSKPLAVLPFTKRYW